MSIYLAEFRPRNVNPAHYDAKMRFWKDMIESFCEYKGSSKVSIHELKLAFKRNGVSPYCLSEVLNQMIAESSVETKDQFMQVPRNSSLAGWAMNSLVVKPLSWGFGKIKERLISSNPDEDTMFVIKEPLKMQSKMLIDHMRQKCKQNMIVTMDDVMREVDEIEGLSRDGVIIALHYLSTVEKSVFVEEIDESTAQSHHHKLLLKFSQPGRQVTPITEIERSIFNLEQTEKFLLETITKKEDQLNETLNQIKTYLKDGKKQLAKSFLRKKHTLEDDLVKTLNVLENIQSMLTRIHASKNDRDIINTYKMGSDAIKASFEKAGMNVDNVADIIEDMQEIYSDQAEIEAAISEPMRGPLAVDDSDLERELLELMEAPKDKNVNNNDGGTTKTPVKPEVVDLLDQELELRLQRLRSDFTFDEPEKPRATKAWN